jgi:hypothetical protein
MPLLRQIIRYAARKAASDPEARDKAIRVARHIAEEATEVARQENRAYAAGRAFRRVMEKSRDS